MPYNPDLHHRRSIRLQGYDYTKAGVYFVTICTYQRLCLFGEIIKGQMQLNLIGQTVIALWKDIPKHFSNVELDEFILMPDHLHGIIIISQQEPSPNFPNKKYAATGTQPNSLGAIVQNFKSISTRKINRINRSPRNFIWQRNYHEQIIRDESTLQNVRQYIGDNPLKWQSDRQINNPL
jgi:REP element-mobilizing transposase RayT